MQCKHHPDRKAEHICVNCSIPICDDCAEEIQSGVYCCFQCAMLQSVSEGGSDISARQKRAAQQRIKKKKKWGPFQYFVVLSSILILVMWGVILFGGQPAPERSTEFVKKGRVLLFMVDGALKRYGHYEDNKYPEKLTDLIPKYLSLRDSELFHLNKLSYESNAEIGYRLSFADPEEGEVNLILSPQGIVQIPLGGGAG